MFSPLSALRVVIVSVCSQSLALQLTSPADAPSLRFYAKARGRDLVPNPVRVINLCGPDDLANFVPSKLEPYISSVNLGEVYPYSLVQPTQSRKKVSSEVEIVFNRPWAYQSACQGLYPALPTP